jgi:hypothetical protein
VTSSEVASIFFRLAGMISSLKIKSKKEVVLYEKKNTFDTYGVDIEFCCFNDSSSAILCD